MSKVIYDLAVVTDTYQNSSGETKNKYTNIGVVLEKDDGGRFMLLDRTFNIAGTMHDPSKGNKVIVSMFDPKPKEERADSPAPAQREQARIVSPFLQGAERSGWDATVGKQAKAGQAEFSDDIPF